MNQNEKNNPPVIWWLRRDLRLTDNDALRAAVRDGRQAIPVFIMDPALLQAKAPLRQQFLFGGLRRLDEDLRLLGSRLILRQGNPAEQLAHLLAETGASAIYAEEDYSPYARRRDAEVVARLPLRLVQGLTVFHPAALTKADNHPYVVFTPFSKAWKSLPFSFTTTGSPHPNLFAATTGLESLPLPEMRPPADFPPGEAEARRRLDRFLGGAVFEYAEGRNRLDQPGTSELSPYLRFGMLSIRAALTAALQALQRADADDRRSVETWINELIWRDFYHSILYHFPGVLKEGFQTGLRGIAWREAPADLQVWQHGETGYPVVDACMRQLAETGWMHNRGRMIAASFLAKDLLINWQEGERWFMRCLVDGEPAANNGGWQWTAGVGTDAAPYFRIFNPLLQGKKFDPEGRFVRRWLPELAHVPLTYIHNPWMMPPDVQSECGVKIGTDYPAPIVDHAIVKERVLNAYKKT